MSFLPYSHILCPRKVEGDHKFPVPSAPLLASPSEELELVPAGRNLLATGVPDQGQGLLPPLPLLYCGLPLSLGWILIDRCGKHFGTILNYLRDGAVPLPESRREIEELFAEAKYYLVQGLADECQAALQVGPRAGRSCVTLAAGRGREEEAAPGRKQRLGRARFSARLPLVAFRGWDEMEALHVLDLLESGHIQKNVLGSSQHLVLHSSGEG